MSARKPAATLAAFAPTTPPPRIVMCAGATPGTPASRMPRPLLRPFEIFRPFLNAHAAGDFAHRREQRQAALVVAERFVGDGSRAGLEHRLGQFSVGGEMEIGEERSGPCGSADTPAAAAL